MPEQNLNNNPQKLPNTTLTLVMGILSLIMSFCCQPIGIILGIIGLINGNKGLALFDTNPEEYLASSHSNIKTGKILSIIGIILSILFLSFSMYIWKTNPEMFDMYREILEGTGVSNETGDE